MTLATPSSCSTYYLQILTILALHKVLNVQMENRSIVGGRNGEVTVGLMVGTMLVCRSGDSLDHF